MRALLHIATLTFEPRAPSLMSGENGTHSLFRDVRHTLRMFRKAPLWTLGVIGTLALGIGATTAMFSIGNSVLLRPLPYPKPGRIVAVWARPPQKGLEQERVTLADFADWRGRSPHLPPNGESLLFASG